MGLIVFGQVPKYELPTMRTARVGLGDLWLYGYLLDTWIRGKRCSGVKSAGQPLLRRHPNAITAAIKGLCLWNARLVRLV